MLLRLLCATSILLRLAKHKPRAYALIGRLTGNLVLIEGNQLLLDVSGVGYEVEVSASVLASKHQVRRAGTVQSQYSISKDIKQVNM